MKVYVLECICINGNNDLGYFTNKDKAEKFIDEHEEEYKAAGRYLGVRELKCLDEDQVEEPSDPENDIGIIETIKQLPSVSIAEKEDDEGSSKEEPYLKKLDKFEAIMMRDQTTREPFIGIHEKESSFALNSRLAPKDVPDFDPNRSYNVYLDRYTEKDTDDLYIKIDNYFVGPIFIPEDVAHRFVD